MGFAIVLQNGADAPAFKPNVVWVCQDPRGIALLKKG